MLITDTAFVAQHWLSISTMTSEGEATAGTLNTPSINREFWTLRKQLEQPG